MDKNYGDGRGFETFFLGLEKGGGGCCTGKHTPLCGGNIKRLKFLNIKLEQIMNKQKFKYVCLAFLFTLTLFTFSTNSHAGDSIKR